MADLGLVGLAVMGENLALNALGKGFTVAVFNRHTDKVDNFVEGRAKGSRVVGCHSLKEVCDALKRPRVVLLMVMAGAPVDEVLSALTPLLATGDVVIDGGNSHFADTERRMRQLRQDYGVHYVGMGVSGGEEGALHGPSLMPGGDEEAWPVLRPLLQAMAAEVPEDRSRCCEWIGGGGAGHFVKMVHNGIEYGDMQLISEVYHLMKEVGGMSNDEIGDTFAEWNKTDELDSYLVEITAVIAKVRNPENRSQHMLDVILDCAEQKGTGKWTGIEALNAGQPVTLIAEAVFARFLSSMKEERERASKVLQGPERLSGIDRVPFTDNLRDALFASKVVSYAQGFSMIRAAAEQHGWRLNYGDIAKTWRSGCIVRSSLLARIREAFAASPSLPSLLVDTSFFGPRLAAAQAGWRAAVCYGARAGVPLPALGAALSFYDGYRCARLPACLVQAQRDYFGAHTFERIDRKRGEKFHFEWSERTAEYA
eukprot:TRINITY_DN10752_c0_g1_i1.p1 TRINITY_DN10752_c0_g1~~TRINITY_DN10752_c0_g1_i1.p1  ORF type:complete len:546 (-),score=133.24 TRINITY_DN10752_c0_g1_i1:91-1536(-)